MKDVPMQHMWRLLLVFWLVIPCLGRPLTEVPDPRPAGWIVDTQHVLDAGTLKQLNQELGEFHQRSGSTLAVAVLDSSDGLPSRQYAHDLFKRWGIDRPGTRDGVLFVLFLRDHRVEVEVGPICRQLMPDDRTSQILQLVVVPQLQAGRPAASISTGVRSILSAMTPAPPPVAETLRARRRRERLLEEEPSHKPGFYILIGTLGLAWLGMLWGRVSPYLSRRRLPRFCFKCRKLMVKLSDRESLPFLNQCQKIEQRMRSVDYDIWSCPACEKQMILGYRVPGSGVGFCKKCQCRSALRLTRREGDGLCTDSFECKQCGNRWQEVHKLSSSDGSSSDSGSNDSSSSGSSDSGSSDSGSGGMGSGGGTSDFGGAGASW